MSLYIVIGTRAQLIKMAPTMALLQARGIAYEFIYTAQHRESIAAILDDFGVKSPDRTLYERSEASTRAAFARWAGTMLLKALRPKKVFPVKGVVMTHGDTATTVWAAIVGKLAGCRVAHVEAGIRSFRLFEPFPEELLRLLTFRFADIYFCPNQWARGNLARYKGEKIDLGVNPIYDALQTALNSKTPVDKPQEPYAVVSLHRFENIFTRRFEETIVPLLEKIAATGPTLVFVLHPSTRNVLQKNSMKLRKRLERQGNILLRERYPYFQFTKLLEAAEFVITDGGSNQEELCYLGKPTLLFREVTERVEGLGENALISHFEETVIMDFVGNYKTWRRERKQVKTSPAQIMVDYLISAGFAAASIRGPKKSSHG